MSETVHFDDEYFGINQLGRYIDGWADTAEGMGEDAEKVRDAVEKQISAKEIPGVKVEFKRPYGCSRRRYLVSKMDPGATTTVYVGKKGTDLYISWRSFIKSVFNWLTPIILVAISLFVGIYRGIRNSSWILSDFQAFLIGFILTFIVCFVILLMLGFFLYENPIALFLKRVTICNAEDITAMNISIHKSILRALDNTGIDVSKLRIKEKFSGGRRGEDI